MLNCVARRVLINWLSVGNNLSPSTFRFRSEKTMRNNFVLLSSIVSAIVLATLVTQGDCQHGRPIVNPPPLPIVDPAPRPARSTVEARPPPLIAVDPPRPRPPTFPPYIAVDPPRPHARLRRSRLPTTERPQPTHTIRLPLKTDDEVHPPLLSHDHRQARSANSPTARPVPPYIAVDPPRPPSIAIDPPRPHARLRRSPSPTTQRPQPVRTIRLPLRTYEEYLADPHRRQ